MNDLYNTILTRKSVRSYDGRPLEAEDREKLEAYLGKLDNPYGIPVTFRLLDAEANGLSSPVLTGEKLYVAGTVGKVPHAEEAYGFSFEKLVLYAWSLGIGTVWIGGTMKRETFEAAAGLGAEERMPCVSPLGYPAKKRALRDSMMRKGIGADARKPLGEIFFDGDPDTPLAAGKELEPLLEMVRWAPSAVNKQPWRVIRRDGLWHFCKKGDKGFLNAATGDLQKIDLGIALCHFFLGAEELGYTPALSLEDPGLSLPGDMEYVASVSLSPRGEG